MLTVWAVGLACAVYAAGDRRTSPARRVVTVLMAFLLPVLGSFLAAVLAVQRLRSRRRAGPDAATP